MAFIKFEEKDRPKALMTLFYNRVPFTCHRGFVFEVPEFAAEKLAQSGYVFERLTDKNGVAIDAEDGTHEPAST